MKQYSIFNKKTFFKDVIHDSIEVTEVARSIIDTPIFQRLRNLHQLGVCYFILPNANNNRFEHSIGTYHLAGLLLDKIVKNSSSEQINNSLVQVDFIKNYLVRNFELTDTDENNIIFLKSINTTLLDDYLIELIKIAGLVHDIGHGPFSHLFDEWIHSLDSNISHSRLAEHESRSVLLLKEIIANKDIVIDDEKYHMSEFIDDEAFEFISELINPSESTPKNFIFQIISNSLNGLDVDKLDYLCRDSFYFGIGKPFDLSRVISHVKVIGGNISFPEKIAYEIYMVFRSRYDLHKQFYTHKTNICIDYMIRDILENIDPILKISKNIQEENISKFVDLVDHTILNTASILKNFDLIYSVWKKQIDSIQKIIERINNRDLYKCIYSESFYVGEQISNSELYERFKTSMSHNSEFDDEFNFDSKNVKVVKLLIGMLSGNKSHPLDTVYFYDKYDNSAFLEKSKISHFITTLHQEIIYYVIYKK
mgnify:CR=1 FL=1